MAGKNIMIILGSPRRAGNSTLLAERVAAGAESGGATVETFYLHGMDISPCRACEACHGAAATGCVVEDDMQELYPKLRETDALVIASPVYWFTMSAQTKIFLDRCYALEGPGGNALKGKQVAILLTYADPDAFCSGAVNALRTFQDIFRYIGAEIVGMIHGSVGKAGAVRDNLEMMTKAYELGRKLAA